MSSPTLENLRYRLDTAKLALNTEIFMSETSGYGLKHLRYYANKFPEVKENAFVLRQAGELHKDVQERLLKLEELEKEVRELESAIAEEEERLKVAEEEKRLRRAEEQQRLSRPEEQRALRRALEQQQFEAAIAASLLDLEASQKQLDEDIAKALELSMADNGGGGGAAE